MQMHIARGSAYTLHTVDKAMFTGDDVLTEDVLFMCHNIWPAKHMTQELERRFSEHT
jgi:hypothetical protein